MYQEIHIAAEARRLQNSGCNDNLKNWYDAIENLKIFPNFTYDLNGIQESLFNIHPISCLGLINKSKFLSWHRCREEFELSFFDVMPQGIFICEKDELRVPNFIRNIEIEKLSLSELTTFMKVKNRNFIFLRPSSFWTTCQMRFSLFTILLKSGHNYFYNSIEDTIKKHPYGIRTFNAIQMFFNGKRNFIGKIPNYYSKWCHFYSHKNENEITTLA